MKNENPQKVRTTFTREPQVTRKPAKPATPNPNPNYKPPIGNKK